MTNSSDVPAGALEPVTDDVWTINAPWGLLGMAMGHRMTVVRLGNGDLLLHSPVPWSEALMESLAELGRPAHWVAPSRTHDLYLDGWFENAAELRSWGAPKLRRPHPDWAFDGWLAEDLDAPWMDEFQILPIEGAPRLGEWVFVHRPSKVAITADLIFNVGDGSPSSHAPVGFFGGMMRRLFRLHGDNRTSVLLRGIIKDRAAFDASLRRLLELDFDTLVVGHGGPIVDDPKAKIRAGWNL